MGGRSCRRGTRGGGCMRTPPITAPTSRWSSFASAVGVGVGLQVVCTDDTVLWFTRATVSRVEGPASPSSASGLPSRQPATPRWRHRADASGQRLGAARRAARVLTRLRPRDAFDEIVAQLDVAANDDAGRVTVVGGPPGAGAREVAIAVAAWLADARRRCWWTATSRRRVSPGVSGCSCSRTCSTPQTWLPAAATSGRRSPFRRRSCHRRPFRSPWLPGCRRRRSGAGAPRRSSKRCWWPVGERGVTRWSHVTDRRGPAALGGPLGCRENCWRRAPGRGRLRSHPPRRASFRGLARRCPTGGDGADGGQQGARGALLLR